MAIAARPIVGQQLSTEGSSCVCGNGPSVSGSGARDSFLGQRLAIQFPIQRSRKQQTARVQMTVHPISTVRSLVNQWLHRKASMEPVNTAAFTPYSMLREKAPTIADLPPSLRNRAVVQERPMPRTEEEERGGNAWGGFDLHADMFKAGRFVDSGFVFRERFAIRCYEVDRKRTASIETIANLMQEVSANHAQAVGFSNDGFATSPLMRERGMIWVTTRMHIEMFRYPKWGDSVEFDTWFQDPGRVGGRRDWNIRDAASGDLIGCGTSKWVMMDQKTRKLAPKDEEVKAELLVYCPQPSKFAPVDKLAASMKICKLEEPPEHTKQNLQLEIVSATDFSRWRQNPVLVRYKGKETATLVAVANIDLQARRSDLDMNHHVNNVAYFGWMLESVPDKIFDHYELASITLEYRRECISDDIVESMTSAEPATSTQSQQFLPHTIQECISDDIVESVTTLGPATSTQSQQALPAGHVAYNHLLRQQEDLSEISRGRTVWRKKHSGSQNGR